MLNFRRSERGQVLVILVVGIVVLLGFTALAVDGGMLYSDRRFDQSVADSAALTGSQYVTNLFINKNVKASSFGCSPSDIDVWKDRSTGWSSRPSWLAGTEFTEIFNRAEDKASDNRITLDTSGSDPNNRVEVRCGVNYFDVKVTVTTTTQTSFAHLLFGGTLRSTVTAIARTQPYSTGLEGYSLYATDENCSNETSNNPQDGGIYFAGGGSNTGEQFAIDISGGGSYSRSCINGNNDPHSYIRSTTNGCFNDQDPATIYECGSEGTFIPPAQTVTTDPLSGFYIDFPDCDNRTIAPVGTVTGDTLAPGYYRDVDLSGVMHLLPGLYCIDVADRDIFNRELDTIPSAQYDEGVTIVFLRAGAFYKWAGNAQWFIQAARSNGTRNAPNLVPGAVLLSKVDFTLDLNGNGQMSEFWGTVYMPNAHLILGGTPSMNPVASQIIVNDLNYNGTGTMQMFYDDSWLFQHPPTMSLNR